MKQKIFLTSCIAMGFVAPAFAEMTDSNTFPNASQGEYMQENTRYIGAATAENMDSVYEGNVNAIAEYTEIPYSAAEGFYLTGVDDNNNATTAECTSGNFCPGVASTTYENNAFGNTGLQSCSTATSGSYTLSDAGASSSGQCYRTCNGNVSILHATGVTGNDYSDGTNTCEPTDCENGWHVKAGVNLDASIAPSQVKYKAISGGSNQSSADTTGLENGDFEAVFSYGNVYGKALCSITTGSNNQTGTPDEDTTGSNCWCKIDGFTPINATKQDISGAWVFRFNYDRANCVDVCAASCIDFLSAPWGNDPEYRSVLLGTASTPAMCEANTITINWNDVDPATAGQNNEGTAVYGEDVRTPFKAKTQKGKTFRGWRFSKPTETNLP